LGPSKSGHGADAELEDGEHCVPQGIHPVESNNCCTLLLGLDMSRVLDENVN